VPVPGDARETLLGFAEAVSPVGETEVARPTVPVKPLMLVMIMVEVLDEPVTTDSLDGVEIVKSVTFTVTVVECDSEPLVATMVTV